ncbi:MAG: hypothetical protein QME12_05695 [Nanoarchaeota archaeon]|nr:hypothetical protein [Nanoarchaeota archaeon]
MGIVDIIRKTLKLRNTFFVCTGNTCRSPMAEHLMKAISLERGLNISVCSRGIGACSEFGFAEREGAYATGHACDAVFALYPDADIWHHVPKPLAYLDVKKASLILAMEELHRDNIIANSLRFYGEEVARKVFTLKEYAGFTQDLDVADPMGTGIRMEFVSGITNYKKASNEEVQAVYVSCRDEIRACLERILDNPLPNTALLLEARAER